MTGSRRSVQSNETSAAPLRVTLPAGGVIWGTCSSQADHGVPNANSRSSWPAGTGPQAGKGPAAACVAIKAAPDLLSSGGRCAVAAHSARWGIWPVGKPRDGEKWVLLPGRPNLEQRNSSMQWLKQDCPRWLMSKEGVRVRALDLRQFAPHQLQTTRMASRTYVIHGSP